MTPSGFVAISPPLIRLAPGAGGGTVDRMRITFPRLPDHRRGYSIVERDDGVVYRLDGGPVTAQLPHDLEHLTVEDALDIHDGIWASIAGGVVFDSMDHVSGRRPPHAADLSRRLMKAHGPDLSRAEMVGGLIARLAELDELNEAMLKRFATRWFTVLPPTALTATHLYRPDGEVDAPRVLVAVDRLRRANADWRALPVGGKLVRNWPPYRRLVPLAARARNAARRPATARVHRVR
jgi:hypothetical protein